MRFEKLVIVLYLVLREFVLELYSPDVFERYFFKGYKRLGKFTVTAYESSEISCGKFSDGRTAINMKVDYGICAIDPEVIPLGVVLYIPDYGYFITADTGKKVKGRIIDIYLKSIEACKRFGNKVLSVYLVKF
jgi:3D (Asp-Asp-Asp) domain-containing protein